MKSTSSLECPKCGHTPCTVIEEKEVWRSHREIWLECPECKRVFRVEIPVEKSGSSLNHIGRIGASQASTLRDILAQ